MEYFPNADAVCWFAESVFGELRKNDPSLEFWIVGRNPHTRSPGLEQDPEHHGYGRRVGSASLPCGRFGFRGAHSDRAGGAEKSLDVIAMGKWTLASPGVCKCFGEELPTGIIPCATAADYSDALSRGLSTFDPAIREQGRRRFSWETNLQIFIEEVEHAIGSRNLCPPSL